VGRKLRVVWKSVWNSLWFIPTVMTGLAFVLAFAMVELDQWLGLEERDAFFWAFEGGSESAFRVVEVIAGTMISVIGVVFSVTVVSLQLASSQFSPLVLRTFTTDRSNQLVFGIFFATFTYSLLILRAIRESADEREVFAAPASASLAIGLALVSVASLIYFINHIARTIQAPVVVDRATKEAHRTIDNLFPGNIGRPAPPDRQGIKNPPGKPGIIRAKEAGYLQYIDEQTIFDLSPVQAVVIAVEPNIGTFILPNTTLAHVWPAEALDEEIEEKIRQSFVLNLEPTTQSDIGFAVRQLSDIATKALSPGINDVATAKVCLDRASELLVRIANIDPPPLVRMARDGNDNVLLVLSTPPFDELVDAGFAPIRNFGSSTPDIASYLLEKLGLLSHLMPEHNREPLRKQAELVLSTARDQISVDEELNRVKKAGSWLDEPLDEDDESPSETNEVDVSAR
jgi:uncharacterized membrane protein